MARGKKTGGRKKGIPNKLTSTARTAFLGVFGKLEGELEQWIRTTATTDPAKASDLVIRMAEYHFPKLGRTEVTGKDGEPVRVSIAINGIRKGVEPPSDAG